MVILAGPNGAGKSTSAGRLLQGTLAVNEFVNADTIALGLSAYRPESASLAAGRAMLARMRSLAASRKDFAFETTLAGRGHGRWIQRLRSDGYRAHLVFLSLSGPDLAVARVGERVRRGGHAVPEDVIRRRFQAGVRNFHTYYIRLVDAWQVFDNSGMAGPSLIASADRGGDPLVVDRAAWQRFHEV